jgi:hypothetical protein
MGHRKNEALYGKQKPISVPKRPNCVWTLDFVHDVLFNRRRIRFQFTPQSKTTALVGRTASLSWRTPPQTRSVVLYAVGVAVGAEQGSASNTQPQE